MFGVFKSDVILKTALEINRLRYPGRVLENMFKELGRILAAGMSTIEIDDFCQTFVSSRYCSLSLFGYRGYPFHVCTSVNNVLAHGLPGSRILSEGDIITIDVIIAHQGWHIDGAWSYIIGRKTPRLLRLVGGAWQATLAGIKMAAAGKRIGDIGHAIMKKAGEYGCVVFDRFVGHGIGTDIHEDPIVYNSGEKETGLPIVPGMVLTIEPIVSIGKDQSTAVLNDGWSIVSSDGSYCAQFEHTIAVTAKRTEILTLQTVENPFKLKYPPF